MVQFSQFIAILILEVERMSGLGSLRRGKNQRGQAMLQAVAVIIVTATVAFMAISRTKQTTKEIQNEQSRDMVRQIEANIKDIVRNDTAWAYSVAAFGNLACLRTGGGSCVGVKDVAISLRNQKNVNWYDPAGDATAGFSVNGLQCTGFNAGAGNPQCPFRVRLVWTAVVPQTGGATDCTAGAELAFGKCAVLVRGDISYNCGCEDQGGADLRRYFDRNDNDGYEFEFVREEKRKTDRITVKQIEASGTDAGQCETGPAAISVGNWTRRTFNTIVEDTGQNVVSIDPDICASNIVLAPGTYKCDLYAPSAVMGRHKARLMVGGMSFPSMSGYFGGMLHASADFTITVNTIVYAEHFFADDYNRQFYHSSPDRENTSMGAYSGQGTNEIYTVLECSKDSN